MSELYDRLAFPKHIGQHLAQLSQLAGREVRSEDLLSLEETNAIRKKSKETQRAPAWRRDLAFSDKSSDRFRKLVDALEQLNPSPVFIWTHLSNVCGLLRPVPLRSVNFDFAFNVDPEGILVVVTSDLCDKMLLDYSLGPDDAQLLELEISGRSWGTSQY